MKPTLILFSLLFALPTLTWAGDDQLATSPTEGVISHDFLGEQQMKSRCLAMLSRFMPYVKSIYKDAGKNKEGEPCGYFMARNSGQSNEDGVRTNADLAMVTAFVWRYGQDNLTALPEGIGYDDLERMATRALNYALSTHRSNQLKACTDKKYWGTKDMHYQWESSLWALSVTLAAHFLNKTEGREGALLRQLLAAEADYELTRKVPTGFAGDTKAEENGWEANVLACACALMPEHEHAAQWREAMIRFAFNCYTVAADAHNGTMMAGRKASEWFEGQNLYDDYTLQNHNYFHTSYQNVVVQELVESMIALRLLGNTPTEKATGNTSLGTLSWRDVERVFCWHWQEVWDEVLAPLALCDGELAMPNGNDWSMFLYDQLPTYAAMATVMRNKDALMLENMALKYTEARQSTTKDGAWMLNSDIGPRRMGVTAHRVMMTYLMHQLFPVDDLKPTEWKAFQRRQAATKLFESQNIVRSMSEDRFVCFSWSEGLKNVNCLIVPNLPDKNKIIVPYKKGIGGNLIGHPFGYRLTGKPKFELDKYTWKASGVLHRGADEITFTITDCGKDKVQLDYAGADSTIGMLAISTDPLTKTQRTLYYEGGSTTTDGQQTLEFASGWVNIDNQIGVISLNEDNRMSFGGRKEVNSIYTTLLYPNTGNTMEKRGTMVYFVNQTAEQTRKLFLKMRK